MHTICVTEMHHFFQNVFFNEMLPIDCGILCWYKSGSLHMDLFEIKGPSYS